MPERNIDWLPPVYTLTRDWTHNLGVCPDQGLNLQPLGVKDNAPTNWATQPGLYQFFIFQLQGLTGGIWFTTFGFLMENVYLVYSITKKTL